MVDVNRNLDAERRVFGTRSMEDRLCIMLYELGSISRCVVHGKSTVDNKERRAYLASALTELSDLILQCDMLRLDILEAKSEVPGPAVEHITFLGLHVDGAERQLERMEEWKQRREETRREEAL